jgi:hypothetical protein
MEEGEREKEEKTKGKRKWKKKKRKKRRERKRERDGGYFGDDCGGVGHMCCDVRSDDSCGARRKGGTGQCQIQVSGQEKGFGEIGLGQEGLSSTTNRILKIIFLACDLIW